METELIKLDVKTGAVVWGSYEFSIRLKKSEFTQRYPECLPSHTKDPALGFFIFELPTLSIDNLHWRLIVVFFYNHIFSMTMRCEEVDTEGEQEKWWLIHLNWISSARTLLIEQLGQPNEIRHPQLDDEDEILSEDQLKLLQSWRYTFRWGAVGLAYESIDMWSGLWISYDIYQQISNWDELASECKDRSEITHSHKDKNQNLTAICSAIDVIRHHFNFEEVRPRLIAHGLMFDLQQWKTRAMLDIEPDRPKGTYLISRDDVVHRVYLNDTASLIKVLHLFLETEKF